MVLFLLLLCALCVPPVCSLFDETCPRKDPPPGVLVVSPGNTLLLTCSGQVKVNGVKVAFNSKNRPTSIRTPRTKKVTSNSAATLTADQTSPRQAEVGIRPVEEENDSVVTVSPHAVHPTSKNRATTGGSDWKDGEKDSDGGFEDDEDGKEGGRGTRDVKVKPQWRWNNQLVQKGGRKHGEFTFTSQDSALCLASVRPTDAGKYTCHHRDKEMFSLKVIVADPPESPSLSCYKKSPYSKVRCEWRSQKPITKPPNCSLFLSKGKTQSFRKIPCSYSPLRSSCWCAFEHNEDEKRVTHVAYLCVTSIGGNATSPWLFFNLLDIIKPDPPANVTAHQEEGQMKKIKITWNFPLSWMQPDDYYQIIYQIRYQPVTSVNNQVQEVKSHSFIINDALPGDEYLIQLRAKEEYDGDWSDWSPPVYARSWTGQADNTDYLTTTNDHLSPLDDSGSGLPDDSYPDAPENDKCANSDDPCKLPYQVFWISGLFAFFSVVLGVYFFRHKDTFKSQLHKLCVITQRADLCPPSSPLTPATPEGKAPVTFVPQLNKEGTPTDTEKEEESEEEQTLMDRTEAMNFNNTSYFFLQES